MIEKNKKINIVMFNMSSYSEWENGIHNRNWQILTHLLANEQVNKIIAIDFLPHNLKRFVRNYFENILSRSKYKVIARSIFSKTVEIDEKLVVYSSVWSKISKNVFYSEIENLFKKLKIKDYFVWSYYPLEIGYFEKLKPSLKIFDAVDNWALHPSFRKLKRKLKDNYHKINRVADIIFTVSKDQENMFDNTEKVFWVPNGVDLKHYQKNYSIVNRDIGEIKHPIIGYVGTIQTRLDADLLEYVVKSNQDKNFVMVGPVWYTKVWEEKRENIMDRFKAYPNIYFLGRKSYDDIPMYIQQFDVGIIPHKVDKFIQSTNPMKIYDYLSNGLSIISTQGVGIKEIDDLILITDDFKKFNQGIQIALTEEGQQPKETRLEIITNHSWLKRVEKMLEIIKKV